MILSVVMIIPTESQLDMIFEYRVTKPSKKPAETVKGNVLISILIPFLSPILKEAMRE